MGKSRSFDVGEHFDGFIEARVREGRYSSAGGVLRTGPRLLEEQETRLVAPRSALIEGEESGVNDSGVLERRRLSFLILAEIRAASDAVIAGSKPRAIRCFTVRPTIAF